MQRKILAVLEAHEAATRDIEGRNNNVRHRLMHKNEIAGAIFGREHVLTASESSSLRRALNKLHAEKRIEGLYAATFHSTLWTANRRWALETFLDITRGYPKVAERLRAQIAEAEAELSVAKRDHTEKEIQNRNT
jgi:hypothetical protein